MESLLEQYGFEKVSPSYFVSPDFGTMLIIGDVFSYDPLVSSVEPEETKRFLEDLMLDAKQQGIICSLIVDLSSIKDEEKEIFPKAIANFNDVPLEEKFTSFVTENAPHFINNRFEGIQKSNVELFVDFDNGPQFTVGNFDINPEGVSKKVVFFQTNNNFSIEDLSKPLPMMEELFSECMFIENNSGRSLHQPSYEDIQPLMEQFPDQKFFYDTTVAFKNSAIFHVVSFHLASDYTEEYDYNDEVEKSAFPKILYIPVVDGEFKTTPEELDSVRNEIRKEKFKTMF